MVDRFLIRSVSALVESHADLSLRAAAAAAELSDQIRLRFVSDPSCRWWWSSLTEVPRIHEYGDADGLSLLAQLANRRSEIFTLMVTDDEFPPWPAVRGTLPGLIAMLRGVRYFEYLLVDDSLQWVLFDTHHNCIVEVGPTEDGMATDDELGAEMGMSPISEGEL